MKLTKAFLKNVLYAFLLWRFDALGIQQNIVKQFIKKTKQQVKSYSCLEITPNKVNLVENKLDATDQSIFCCFHLLREFGEYILSRAHSRVRYVGPRRI